MQLTFPRKLGNIIFTGKVPIKKCLSSKLFNKGYFSAPYEGIGKSETLKHGLAGYWSRRINDEHRIVYKFQNDAIFIAQLRYHYST